MFNYNVTPHSGLKRVRGYVYVLTADDYNAAQYMLRRLRKRKAELKKAILIVEVEHWNKVKDFITKAKKNELILMP